jgi:hypothetical protein
VVIDGTRWARTSWGRVANWKKSESHFSLRIGMNDGPDVEETTPLLGDQRGANLPWLVSAKTAA